MLMQFIVHTDGGARGNPGPAAVGVVIERQQRTRDNKQETIILCEFGKRIGETTNNVAEYTAVIEALTEVKRQKEKVKSEYAGQMEIQFFLDSKLVVEQLNGNFKVKDAKLRELMMQVKILEQECRGEVTYAYVPREENSRADYFVNKALDEQSNNTTK